LSSERYRIIQTLWFEDVGLLYEPIIDTPVGRLTLRQTFGLLIFAVLAYAATLPFTDIVFKVAAGGAVFVLGAAIFTRRVKTVTAERCILLALGVRRLSPKKPGKNLEKRGRVRKHERIVEAPTPVKAMKLSTELNIPVKIVSVLGDPLTNELLAGRGFEFIVDGVRYSSGVTDEQGFFTVFFAPTRFGIYRVEIKPEGFASASQTFEIHAEPKRGVKAV
jgi:hypothetical protein